MARERNPLPSIDVHSRWDRGPLDPAYPPPLPLTGRYYQQYTATTTTSSPSPSPRYSKFPTDITPHDPRGTFIDTKPRKGFWSKLRRCKSDDCHRPLGTSTNNNNNAPSLIDKTVPQRAKPGANLVWSSEQQIWLFARDDAVVSTTAVIESDTRQHLDTTQTQSQSQSQLEPNQPNPTLGLGISKQFNDYDEDQLLFAQLPGHYTLSIYDCVNNAPPLDYLDVTDERGGQGSPWMAVAKRVGPPKQV